MSERVIDDIERGIRSNYAPATLAAIEHALGWTPGACLRIVAGGIVRRELDPVLVRLLDTWRLLSPDARAMLVEIAERAAKHRHD